MTAAEPTAETWTAMGTRLDAAGKRHQAFRDPDGHARYWADQTSYVIGGRYELAITRDGDTVTRTGKPVYAGPGDEPLVAEWEIKSEAAERKLARLRRERAAKRDAGKLDAACKPLTDLAAGLRSYEDVEALLASVRRRVYDSWGTGGAR